MNGNQIIKQLPYGKEFLFVDEILKISEDGVYGTYMYPESLYFYESHFKNSPVTPAVILTETMAQIGLVCLGLFLLKDKIDQKEMSLAMTSNNIDFMKPVYPGEKVWVSSTKKYFRFNKLSCSVKMENAQGEMVCKGTIAGMLIAKKHE